MRSVSKPSALRLIVPKILAQRTIANLTTIGKTEANELILETGGLTTDNIVRYIKDYTKLRDEIGQTVRQLGIERDPEPVTPEVSDLKVRYSDVETQAIDARADYQKLQSEFDAVDRQLQELERKIAVVDQLKMTGFSNEELMSKALGFRRFLGRVPVKKLDAVQKAVRASLKDTTVMTTGAKKGDSIFLLVVTPTEDTQHTLQTLLLYDFASTDVPSFDDSDPETAIEAWRTRKDALARERQLVNDKLEDLRKNLAPALNLSADKIGETLLVLRGSLRLGEGSSVAHIFARLDKPLGPVTLNTLQKDGVFELD